MPDKRSGSAAGNTPAGAPMTGWQRLSQTFLRPPKPNTRPSQPAAEQVDLASLTDEQKRARITQIDPLERKIGLAASAFGVVLTVIATVPYMISKIVVATTTKPVGHHCPGGLTYTAHGSQAATCNGVYPPSHYAVYLVVFLIFSAAIFVSVRMGRRSALAFTVVLTGLGLASSVSLIVCLPFLIVGGWILLRSFRAQKYGAPNAKSPLPGWAPPAPRSFSGRAKKSAPRPASRSAAGPKAAERKAPAANKRYTPKAPPKKKTSPSGRG